MKPKLVVLCLTLSLVLALAACGTRSNGSNTDSGNATQTPSETKKPDNNTQAATFPMTFDNYGRSITIEAKPTKVLALGPNCAEMMAALGLSEYVIGTSLRNHSRGPLPEYADAVNAMPELNHSSATREGVITSGADFIYGIDWEFGGSGLDTTELESYGMVTYLNQATTIEEVYQEIRDIGKIFGVADKAEAFIADQQARVESVKNKVSGQTAPNVLVCDSINAGIFTASGVNYATLLLETAGGKNIFGDLTEKAWVTVSYEEVLAREPEIIVIFDYDSPSVEEKKAELKANDILSQLNAVKNERYVIITLESVLSGGRTAYVIEEMAKGFYPDLF
jgi:iron complex transport system substrate-binding protein